MLVLEEQVSASSKALHNFVIDRVQHGINSKIGRSFKIKLFRNILHILILYKVVVHIQVENLISGSGFWLFATIIELLPLNIILHIVDFLYKNLL